MIIHARIDEWTNGWMTQKSVVVAAKGLVLVDAFEAAGACDVGEATRLCWWWNATKPLKLIDGSDDSDDDDDNGSWGS